MAKKRSEKFWVKSIRIKIRNEKNAVAECEKKKETINTSSFVLYFHPSTEVAVMQQIENPRILIWFLDLILLEAIELRLNMNDKNTVKRISILRIYFNKK